MLRARRELGTRILLENWQICGRSIHTPKSVDSPLFKLLKRDICCWRGRVEVESVGILNFFVRRVCKLLLAVVDGSSPFAVVAIEVLTDHIDGCVIPLDGRMFNCPDVFGRKLRMSTTMGLVWETRLDA